jgi:hypothetical protein
MTLMSRGRPTLSSLALILALSSLAYAGYLHFTLSERLAKAADTALRQRERQLVSHFYPSLRRLFKDLGQQLPEEPETLEELLGPLFQVEGTIRK